MSEESQLWCGVINQAIRDCRCLMQTVPVNPADKYAMIDSATWLSRPSRGLYEVMLLAGIERGGIDKLHEIGRTALDAVRPQQELGR